MLDFHFRKIHHRPGSAYFFAHILPAVLLARGFQLIEWQQKLPFRTFFIEPEKRPNVPLDDSFKVKTAQPPQTLTVSE